MKRGRVETPVGIGHLVLQRVGSGADIGLVAMIVPGATPAAHARHVAPEARTRTGRTCRSGYRRARDATGTTGGP